MESKELELIKKYGPDNAELQALYDQHCEYERMLGPGAGDQAVEEEEAGGQDPASGHPRPVQESGGLEAWSSPGLRSCWSA
jgi:hypothetical protein